MESKPVVSVIIPTYNSDKYLAEAIESALDQTYKNLEIIVVDDGSTDNTRELVKQYESKIHYIYQENQERSAARNTGIKYSRGKYLQFLDADDIILPEKLELQVDFLENNLDYAVVYSDIRSFNDFDRTKLTPKNCKFYSGNILKELLRDNFISVHPALIRRLCIDKVGLFQVRFNLCEDWDFWLRVAYAGYKFYYMDKVLALYRWHGDNTCSDYLKLARARLEVIKSVDNYISSENIKKDLGVRKELAFRQWNLGRVLIQHGL
ncbi:MAG: glycosyltransferase, partial [Planctomycetota bacterium]|nr:glycosyltransferase [Planctomycetota bacterium]